VIAAGDLSLFYRSDDIDEAYAYIVRHLSGNEQNRAPCSEEAQNRASGRSTSRVHLLSRAYSARFRN